MKGPRNRFITQNNDGWSWETTNGGSDSMIELTGADDLNNAIVCGMLLCAHYRVSHAGLDSLYESMIESKQKTSIWLEEGRKEREEEEGEEEGEEEEKTPMGLAAANAVTPMTLQRVPFEPPDSI